MGRMIGAFAILTLTGCASAPPETVPDPRPAITVECVTRPNPPRDRPFERCKLISVSPDTPDVHRLAEDLLEKLPVAERRSPSEALIDAQTMRFRVRLNPDGAVEETTTGDGPDAPR